MFIKEENIIITIDVDWAPDFMVRRVIEMLLEKNVKATWFVTNESETLNEIRKYKENFEIGIHPNMLDGSTHGKTEDEVLSYMKSLAPEAVSMRTHGLYQTSNWLIKASKEYGIKIDVSLFLPRTHYLQPHVVKWHGISLCRIPYFWEDDSEMSEEKPIWNVEDGRLYGDGLKIFDFHPVHLILNTVNYEDYEKLKKIKPLSEWNEDFVKEHFNEGEGPLTLFKQLLDKIKGKGFLVKEIAERYLQ